MRKTVNIHNAHDCQVVFMADGFVLEFLSEKHKVRLHLADWWPRFLASCLWKVINHTKEEVAKQEAAMKGDSS